MLKIIHSLLAIAIALALPSFVAAAEKRVKPTDLRSLIVTAQKKNHRIYCLSRTPGKTRKSKGKVYFTPFKDEEKSLSKKRKRTRSENSRLALVKVLRKEGEKKCSLASGDHLSLDTYSGSFGYAEAQLLFNRFAFGGTPAQIQNAVNVGLNKAVNMLLTVGSEPHIEAVAADIECDSWRSDDPEAGSANRQCSSSNINDMNRGGMRSALLYRFINSVNPFFQRFAFFLMDERMAVSHLAARDCERHAIRTYLSSVYRAALLGDYRQFMYDMNRDQLMHLRWLDGGTNRGGFALSPNENYAREFWELGTVGPKDLNGKPVYSDLDIAQSALAFTGWTIEETNVGNNYVCLASYVPLFHSGGPKRIFINTPYQATVENADDVLNATFKHPRTAEHLAEDLWKEFINPFATANQIQELAKLIHDNKYNLLPVFKRLMTSKALYASKSRNSLIKHPIELITTFVKTTGFPLYYRNYDSIMSRLEQQVLNPNTVFGWDVKYLSGQQLQIEWWNVLVDYFININIGDVKKDHNWSYYDRFVLDLHNAGKRTSLDVIDRVARDFGITINAAQRAEVDQLMNFYLSKWGCPAQCNGMPYRLIREAYDTNPQANESNYENGQRRLRMLITALLELPEARTK